ncbi:MAG: hypothetical protein ACKV19_28845 [Verrucomicrobiales bacterium]
MKLPISFLASLLAIAGLTATHAASIVQVGVDSSTGRDWRTSGTVKPNDVNGDNIYGTDGYRIASFAGADNPLNIQQPGYATYALASGIAGFEGPGNETHQSSFDDVTQTGVGPVPDIIAGDWYRGGGGGPNVQDFFTITLTAPASFRLGVIGDQTSNNPNGLINESSDAVQVVGPGGADSGLLLSPAKNSIPDYYLFDITGNAGDVFTIMGRNNTGWSDNALGGFFIDTIPEPSVSLLGIVGCFGLVLRRRR